MVNIVLNKVNNHIKNIKIFGHANFLKYKNDIVCAAITGVVVGALNGVDQLFQKNEINLNISKNLVVFNVNDLEDKTLQSILSFMIIQLETIQVQYSENLQIKEI